MERCTGGEKSAGPIHFYLRENVGEETGLRGQPAERGKLGRTTNIPRSLLCMALGTVKDVAMKVKQKTGNFPALKRKLTATRPKPEERPTKKGEKMG